MPVVPYSQWPRDVNRDAPRLRREYVGVVNNQPAWLENSGERNNSQLWIGGRAVSPREHAVTSGLLGYNSRCWAQLSQDWLALLWGREHLVAIMNVNGDVVHEIDLPAQVVAGSLTALDSQVVCVFDHGPDEGREIVMLDQESLSWRTLLTTTDFIGDLTSTAFRLAWLSWSPQSMPWESARLHVAEYFDAQLRDEVVWGDGTRAYAQPLLKGDSLYWSYEADEWFVPQRARLDAATESVQWQPVPMSPVPEGEFRPDWFLGNRWFAPLASATFCVYVHQSVTRAGLWRESEFVPVDNCPVAVRDVIVIGERVLVLADTTETTHGLWWFDPRTMTWESASNVAASRRDRRPVVSTSATGTPYVLWRPSREDYQAPADDLPGLVVGVHGGPTGYQSLGYDSLIDELTSSGLCFAGVNYRGSASFGRRYRQALNGHWGEFDVHDACDVANDLVARGIVDPQRCFIRGSSAGGMTALLASCSGVFSGVAVLYAVTSLRQLAIASNEFERHYVSTLVGASSIDDPAFDTRSPLQRVGEMPRMLVLQGDLDDVVPVAQARALVAMARDKGVACEYIEFAGEGHGFRSVENRQRAIEAEWLFYRVAVET